MNCQDSLSDNLPVGICSAELPKSKSGCPSEHGAQRIVRKLINFRTGSDRALGITSPSAQNVYDLQTRQQCVLRDGFRHDRASSREHGHHVNCVLCPWNFRRSRAAAAA